MDLKVLKTLNYKVGYQVRTEEFQYSENEPPMMMRNAYTPEGAWIGTPKQARDLIVKNGVMPELAEPDANICTVGFREEDQKWYGWSHRAICGFGKGDKLFEEDWPRGDENTPFIVHGDVVIETNDQARQAAVNFASYVS